MITVAVANDAYSNVFVAGGDSFPNYAMDPMNFVTGGIAIQYDVYGYRVYSSEYQFEIGRMIEGLDRPVGPLRDKEVEHFNATGTITIGGLTRKLAETPQAYPESTYTSPPTKWLQNVQGDWVPVRGTALWGSDAKFMVQLGQYTYTHPTLPTTVTVGPVDWEISVAFNGDTCLVQTKRLPFQSVPSNPAFSSSVSSPLVHAVWYRLLRESDGLLHIKRSPFYTSKVKDGFVVLDLPGGRTKIDDVNVASYPSSPWGFVGILPDYAFTELDGTQLAYVKDSTIAALKDGSHINWVVQHFLRNPPQIPWGKLSMEICESQDIFDVNQFFTVFDLFNSPEDLLKWKNLSKLVADASKNLSKGERTLDSLKDILNGTTSSYLGVSYGVLPTSDELIETGKGMSKLAKLFQEDRRRRMHSRCNVTTEVGNDFPNITSQAVLTVEVNPYPSDVFGFLAEVLETWRRIGFNPSLIGLVDLVPFSFVLQWFWDFEKYLDFSDQFTRLQNFQVDYYMEGVKRNFTIPVERMWPHLDGLATGDVTYSHYSRIIAVGQPLPLPEPEESRDPDARVVHNRSTQGAALTYQVTAGKVQEWATKVLGRRRAR